MKFQIITLFSEMFDKVLNSSMLWKAQDKKLVNYNLINLRDFGLGPRKQVDDTPYGGGDGMVLKPEPLFAAVAHAKKNDKTARVLLMTPRGKTFNQKTARRLVKDNKGLVIICGHYEGYDERITALVDEEISVGNYVLTGGEIPAMVVTDAVTRLIPGVLGGANSAAEESFSTQDEKEYPHYTRPEEFQGMKVPEVLLSGNHAQIAAWRKDNQR